MDSNINSNEDTHMIHDLLTIPIVFGTAISLVSLVVIFLGLGLCIVHWRIKRHPLVKAVYTAEPWLCYIAFVSKPQKEKSFFSKVIRKLSVFFLWLHIKLGIEVR